MKTNAGEILKKIIADGCEDELLVITRKPDATKISCAAYLSSTNTQAYMIAGAICQMASKFNTTPLHFAARIIDALNCFIALEYAERENENG